jgi:RHS repeat-associated protein
VVLNLFVFGVCPVTSLFVNLYGHYFFVIHTDVTQLANENGTVVKNYDYDAWGTPTKDEGEEIDNPIRYVGEYFDDESGMIYLRARYYQPEVGRFISEDPAKDGMNWYGYCAGNPVMNIDPTGLAADSNLYDDLERKILNLLTIKAKYMALYDEYIGLSDFSYGNSDDYDTIFAQLHAEANKIRDSIYNSEILKNQPLLSGFIHDVLEKEGGATIEETSALFAVIEGYEDKKGNISYDTMYNQYYAPNCTTNVIILPHLNEQSDSRKILDLANIYLKGRVIGGQNELYGNGRRMIKWYNITHPVEGEEDGGTIKLK